MIFKYLRLVVCGTHTILWFCSLYILPPFVKMHEGDSSIEIRRTVLKKINNILNRHMHITTKRPGIENCLKSKDISTYYGNENINIDDIDVDDKNSTNFWLESNRLMKTKRRQREKYTDRDLHEFANNLGLNNADNINSNIRRYRYGFYKDTKLKSCNQKYHTKDRYAKSNNLTIIQTIEFGVGDTSATEDVKLRKEKLLDLRTTNQEYVGLSTNDTNVQNHISEIVRPKKSNKEIKDSMITKILKKVMNKRVHLDTRVQHNLRNTTRRKINRKIRFASWLEDKEDNTVTNYLSDFTAISNTGLADRLTTRTRVLCWIMISTPQKLDQSFHITAIMDTWGKRCTKVLIMTSNHSFSSVEPVPIVKLNTKVENSTWSKTMEAIRYLYRYHLPDADWFLGTDDSTYVIMENLRYMLSEYNTKDPLYFDCHYKSPSARSSVTNITSYVYVLSQEAVKRFGLSSPFKCECNDDGPDSVKLGLCLQNLSVDVIDTRDSLGRGRFFTYALEDAIFSQEKNKKIPKKKKKIHKKQKKGIGCFSDYAVSFYQKDPKDLYVMEYLVYHLRPYGVWFGAANNIAGPGVKIPNQTKQTKDASSVIDGEINEERDVIYADQSVADEMARRVRVLCFVLTFPDHHQRQAMDVKATWGKRCNILLFMSTKFDPNLPTIALPVQEGYFHLWGKTREALRYVYEHHRDDADWFMKADDDSYVVLENLRYMLSKYNTTDPMYFGLRFKSSESFLAGGPGYVLSRAALDKFVREGLPHPHLCRADVDTHLEDYELALCFGNIGVKMMDTRDSMLRGRFFFCPLRDHYFPAPARLWKDMYYGMPTGLKCCSKYAISFHRTSLSRIHVMEYIVYHLKPYGYLWNGTETVEYISKKLEKYIRPYIRSNKQFKYF